MLVVARSEVNKKQRIYHRCGCMYAPRIKSTKRTFRKVLLRKGGRIG